MRKFLMMAAMLFSATQAYAADVEYHYPDKNVKVHAGDVVHVHFNFDTDKNKVALYLPTSLGKKPLMCPKPPYDLTFTVPNDGKTYNLTIVPKEKSAHSKEGLLEFAANLDPTDIWNP